MTRRIGTALAVLVAVLALTASASAATLGIDFGWGAPSTASLKAAGVKFAVSYLSHDRSKDWTRADVDRLHAAGITTVAVFESTASRALYGYAAGQADARTADAEARGLGMPATRPLYFAVDCEASGASVASYFRGVASVLGASRTGVYAGLAVVNYLHAAGIVRYVWQTYAWSYGVLAPFAQLHQFSNDHLLGGRGVDFDHAYALDYGQWPYGPAPVSPAMRRRIAAWHRAEISSLRAYQATGGPVLRQRIRWFSGRLAADPFSTKAPAQARALAASEAAWQRRRCALYLGRVAFFRHRIAQGRA